MERRPMVVAALAVSLALAACGDDGSTSTEPTPPASAPGSADDQNQSAGEVPDPCDLLDPAVVTSALGTDPGAGTVSGPAPTERKICTFGTGLILAIEVADHYEASVSIIRDDPLGATIVDVSGVGAEAIWQDFSGGVGQLVARGDEYFVGVSVPAGGQDAAQSIAEAMLAAL